MVKCMRVCARTCILPRTAIDLGLEYCGYAIDIYRKIEGSEIKSGTLIMNGIYIHEISFVLVFYIQFNDSILINDHFDYNNIITISRLLDYHVRSRFYKEF